MHSHVARCVTGRVTKWVAHLERLVLSQQALRRLGPCGRRAAEAHNFYGIQTAAAAVIWQMDAQPAREWQLPGALSPRKIDPLHTPIGPHRAPRSRRSAA